MTEQSLEVAVARMDERMNVLVTNDADARQSRKEMHHLIEQQNRVLDTMSNRLEKIENWMLNSDPTIQEYRAFKAQATGAGRLGRWVWALAMATLGAAVMLVTLKQKWFGG